MRLNTNTQGPTDHAVALDAMAGLVHTGSHTPPAIPVSKDAMDLLKHDILHEFPQLKDKIQALRSGNAHFSKLFDQYDVLNRSIAKFEGGVGAISDEALEIEKKKRLKLKDEITQMLTQP